VIGDSATYGKGKIQSVYELADGSALFVTIARYKTPVRDKWCSCHPHKLAQQALGSMTVVRRVRH